MKIGSIKISVFTIISILFLILIFLIPTYFDKKILDMQRDNFYKWSSLVDKDKSDSVWDSYQESYVQSQIYSTRYKISMVATFLFFWMILISWRIDSLEKH